MLKINSLKKISAVLIFTLLCFELLSQNLKDTLIRIGEVKITDTKISKPDRVIAICFEDQKINSEIIRQNNIKSLAELLTENSNIFIKSYGQGSLATASIRGSGASHTQVLWNGISLNNPMLGQTDFSQIPVFFIDNAEISEGGSSLFSVSGALGGSILLNSLPYTGKNFSSEIIQTFGSNETFQTFLKIAEGNSKINTVFKLYGEQSENDFLFYNNAAGNPEYERQKNADYTKNALLNTTSINFSENNKLTLNTWFQYGKRNIPPIMSFLGAGRIEYERDKNIKTVTKYYFRKNKTKNEITAAFINENLDYFSGTELITHTNSESNTKRFFTKFSSNYNLNKKIFLKTELNAEYQKAEYLDKKTGISYKADRKIADFMLYADYKTNKNVFFFTLVRTNYTDNYFLPLMPSAGFKFDFNKIPLYINTSISRNYKNPTLNDLYWIPGGNINLKPEEGYTADLSLNLKPVKKGKFTTKTNLTLYASYINNWIIWQPGDFLYWKAENIKKVFSRGAEFSFSEKYSVNKLKIWFKTNYSYTKTTNQTDAGDNSYGKQLIYIPVHKANMFLKFNYIKWNLRFSQTYTGQRFTTSSNEEIRHVLPAFSIENLSAGRKFDIKKADFEIQFKIKNIFNTQYQEILWRAMPGRQFLLLIRIEI